LHTTSASLHRSTMLHRRKIGRPAARSPGPPRTRATAPPCHNRGRPPGHALALVPISCHDSPERFRLAPGPGPPGQTGFRFSIPIPPSGQGLGLGRPPGPRPHQDGAHPGRPGSRTRAPDRRATWARAGRGRPPRSAPRAAPRSPDRRTRSAAQIGAPGAPGRPGPGPGRIPIQGDGWPRLQGLGPRAAHQAPAWPPSRWRPATRARAPGRPPGGAPGRAPGRPGARAPGKRKGPPDRRASSRLQDVRTV
jgi:translation initiation factor IF-2